MVEGQITPSGKRIITKIFSGFVNIIYDRGYYWKVENAALTPYKTKELLKTPAHDYAEILTIIENGKFITLINFEEFNTYTVIEGLTDEPNDIKKGLPKIKTVKKKDLYKYRGIIAKKDAPELEEEVPAIIDSVVDVYNRIYGIWKVRSYMPPNKEIVEVIYNEYQELPYYIVYDNDKNLVISPIVTFLFEHPLGPKIIDLAKDAAITDRGYNGFGLYRAVQKYSEWINENFENKEVANGEEDDETKKKIEEFKEIFKQKIEIVAISKAAKDLTLENEGPYVLLPFIDGAEPVYSSIFGFYSGKPKDFTPEKAVRSLEKLIKPGYYSDGDYEIKIFDDLSYAVRYGKYVLIPCCLAKTVEPISIENAGTPEDVAGEILKTGYEYATRDPRSYTMLMKFDVPDFNF